MSKKVLGFKERENDRQDHVKNWETREIWVEKV